MQLLLVFLTVNVVSSILIGKIDNCSYVAAAALTLRFNGTSCDACLCETLLLYSSTFVALNCYGNGWQCDLFLNRSNLFDMLLNRNSACYIYPDVTRSTTLAGMML